MMSYDLLCWYLISQSPCLLLLWCSGGFCTHSFKDHKEIVNVVRFHPDPYRLLLFSLSADKTCKTFDLNGQACVASFCNHVSPPTDFSLSPDGYLMVTVGRDKVYLSKNYSFLFVFIVSCLQCSTSVPSSISFFSSVLLLLLLLLCVYVMCVQLRNELHQN